MRPKLKAILMKLLAGRDENKKRLLSSSASPQVLIARLRLLKEMHQLD